MKHPKLKHARLCQAVLVTLTVLLPWLPFIGFYWWFLPLRGQIPHLLYKIVCYGVPFPAAMVVICLSLTWTELNYELETMDSYRTARTKYPLPEGFSEVRLQRVLRRFGSPKEPLSTEPMPDLLRYRTKYSPMADCCGIQRTVLVYHVDTLTAENLPEMLHSARENARALWKCSATRQKSAPMHRCTVPFLFAGQVEPALKAQLYEALCKYTGNADTDVLMPCVIDLSDRSCTFDCLRTPWIIGSIPAKNRCRRIIRRCVFGGALPYRNNPHRIPPPAALDPEMSLWDRWGRHRRLERDGGRASRSVRRTLRTMSHGEVRLDHENLYLRWKDHGAWVVFAIDPDRPLIRISHPDFWSYPTSGAIRSRSVQTLEHHLAEYLRARGYTAEFCSLEELETTQLS